MIAVARPVLKWAGGKRQIADVIVRKIDQMFPDTIDTYHERFVGGGAIFFELSARKRFRRARLSDTNRELMGMYEALRDDASIVIGELEHLEGLLSEKGFYEVRAWLPTNRYEAAARTIFLNKTCYNGLYRVNKQGLFNTPYGHRKKVQLIDRGNLHLVQHALQKADLHVCSFTAPNDPGPPDFSYYDPPYVPVSASSDFTAYSVEGFDKHAQAALASHFRRLTERGKFHALLSNSHCKETLRLYQGFVRHRIAARRSISAAAASRVAISELLVESRLRPIRKKK